MIISKMMETEKEFCNHAGTEEDPCECNFQEKEFDLEEENRSILHSAMQEEWEFRHGWDGDWSKVVNQYDGTR